MHEAYGVRYQIYKRSCLLKTHQLATQLNRRFKTVFYCFEPFLFVQKAQ